MKLNINIILLIIERGNYMKKRNGFTLVELLAVIVVLAIIMIIAIPAVLDVMNNARKSSFALYIEKVVRDVQTQYVSDSNSGSIAGSGIFVYDITADLGYNTTGSYVGYVVVNAQDVDNVKYIIYLHDNNYMIVGHNITDSKMPTKDSSSIVAYNASTWSTGAGNSLLACQNYESSAGIASSVSCKNRNGYILSN
jgi:type IV pilus assembly protein PilA